MLIFMGPHILTQLEKKVDILDDEIHEEAKMPSTLNASIYIVPGCD